MAQESKNHDKAFFAAGCFWGVESTFQALEGVISTTVGYATLNLHLTLNHTTWLKKAQRKLHLSGRLSTPSNPASHPRRAPCGIANRSTTAATDMESSAGRPGTGVGVAGNPEDAD